MALRGDVNFEDVAEALFHEGNSFVVWRPRRALAEVRQADDIRWQRILGAALPRALGGACEEKNGHRNDQKTHGEESGAFAGTLSRMGTDEHLAFDALNPR